MKKKEKKSPYELFRDRFDPVVEEHVKSHQQIKYAHSRAQEAAEDAVGHNYKKLVDDGGLQKKYISTFRSTLKKEIIRRFKGKIGGLGDKVEDNPVLDQLLESIGVPKAHDLEAIFGGMDEYDPNAIEGELSQYQSAFLQQYLSGVPAKYARKPEDKQHFLKRLGVHEDIDHQLATEQDLIRLLTTYVQTGGLLKRHHVRKEIRKKRKK